jgi:septal ring factor EnvC (AmiA/AmiB activator)
MQLKNVTVREVAKALGLTKRAIMYRLEDGRLKGVRVKNDNGQTEWRVYPTKEIIDALNKLAETNPSTEPVTPEVDEVIDADIELEDELEAETSAREWEERQRAQMKAMAEEFMRPLMERFDAQSRALANKEREIEELKIKLLPDLQQRAEEERKAAELKELEVIALQKQLDAVREAEEQKLAAIASENEALRGQVQEIEARTEAEKAKLEEEKAALQAALDAKSKSWWQKMWSSPQ